MVSKFTYLFFSMEFLWRSFPLLRANRLYAIFSIGLKKWLLRVRDILFVFFYPEYLSLVLSATNPVQQLTFLIVYFRWQEGVPTSVSESQPIIWLLSSSPLARRSVRATIYHSVSHSFSIRSPSTNICFSILTWICYFGIDPHSYDVLTVILWWLATVNSNTRIVVILFLSSQWETTWHMYNKKFQLNISHFFYTQLNNQTVLFQTILFSMLSVCTLLKCQTVLFDT